MRTKKPLRSQELRALGTILYDKTGWVLKKYLIEQAFTRSSYSKRFGGGSNENLEFIGDTILGYHVVYRLYNHYGTIHSDEDGCYYSFRAHEKDFTALKSTIVSNRTLAAIIDEWDVCQYLIVGQSDIDNEVDKQEKIKADLFEAIIGAYAVLKTTTGDNYISYVDFREYDKRNSIWKKYPTSMIRKVAENDVYQRFVDINGLNDYESMPNKFYKDLKEDEFNQEFEPIDIQEIIDDVEEEPQDDLEQEE